MKQAYQIEEKDDWCCEWVIEFWKFGNINDGSFVLGVTLGCTSAQLIFFSENK